MSMIDQVPALMYQHGHPRPFQRAMVVDPRDYSEHVGDGDNDAAAIQAAEDDVAAAGGGVVFFPVPQIEYRCDEQITRHENVAWIGAGTDNANGPVVIRYTGTATPFIDATFTSWVNTANLAIVYSNSSFTGYLIDASAASGDASAHHTYESCYLGSNDPGGLRSATATIKTTGVVRFQFTKTSFRGGQHAVHGLDVNAASADNFAAVVNFTECWFSHFDDYAILNPGGTWSFDGCIWERSPADEVGRACTTEAGLRSGPVTFDSCWGGDNTANGAWIEWRGDGLTITGGSFYPRGGEVVRVKEASHGIVVLGFHGETTFSSGALLNFADGDAADSTGVVALGFFMDQGRDISGPNRPSGSITHANTGIQAQVDGSLVVRDGTLNMNGSRTVPETETFADGATTPDVGSADHFEAAHSSATTMTDFTGASNGQTITIRAANGNTTLQDAANGSNLHLAGSVDFAMSARSIVTLRFNGASWEEVSRSEN